MARKASFGGENLHIYPQMPLLRYSLSFLYGIAFFGKRFRLCADCTCFHAANPKAGKGLFAIRLFIDKAEKEFPLAPAVASIDNLGNVAAVHKVFEMCIRDSTTTYRQLKPIYDEYRKSPDKEKYLRGHESEIILLQPEESHPIYNLYNQFYL